MDATAHLTLLTRLMQVARPGGLFPDARRIAEWLSLCVAPRAPKIDVDRASGFPSRKSLERLLERQAMAREVFRAHRARPARGAAQFHGALAASELWAPGLEVRVMSADKTQSRLMVVHDRFDEHGCPARFTLQLQQTGTRHVQIERGEVASARELFRLAIEEACDDDASVAALRLVQLEGIAISEVVRGVLGPMTTAHAPALSEHAAITGSEDDGVLCLTLERVGETVEQGEAVLPDLRASRETKWVCTPRIEGAVRAQAKGTRTLVRSR